MAGQQELRCGQSSGEDKDEPFGWPGDGGEHSLRVSQGHRRSPQQAEPHIEQGQFPPRPLVASEQEEKEENQMSQADGCSQTGHVRPDFRHGLLPR
jgi:hypothetical protein